MSGVSLRARLTLLYGGLFVLASAIALVAVYLVVQHQLEEELNSEAVNSRIAMLRAQAAETGESTFTLQDGTTVSLDQLLEQAQEDQEHIKDAALHALIVQGGIAIMAVGVIAAGAGWVVAGRGLQPLHAITATARRIAGSRGVGRDLNERIGLTGRDDDIKSLADSFDAMLQNLSQAFDGQRRFVANASHELRTPLALERALLELEATKPSATADVQHFCQSLLAINERHTRLIDGLLQLVDSENEVTNPEPVELEEVVTYVVATASAAANDAQIEISSSLVPVVVEGDPVMLEQLVRNLVENGIQHNQAGGWLRVEARIVGERAILAVSNSGEVIAEYDVPRLFEPFQQLGEVRTASGGQRGFGLGLSIVRAIANAHGGKVSAEVREGGGLVVRVSLPLSTTD